MEHPGIYSICPLALIASYYKCVCACLVWFRSLVVTMYTPCAPFYSLTCYLFFVVAAAAAADSVRPLFFLPNLRSPTQMSISIFIIARAIQVIMILRKHYDLWALWLVTLLLNSEKGGGLPFHSSSSSSCCSAESYVMHSVFAQRK